MKSLILLVVLCLLYAWPCCAAKLQEWKQHKAVADRAFSRGQLEKAEAEYLQEWKLVEKEDHLSTDLAGAACDLAQVYGARKNYAGMQPKLIMAYLTGRMLNKEGKSAAADAIFQRAFAIAEKAYGPNDSRMGTHLAQVASYFEERKNYDLALKYCERDLKLKQASEASDEELSVAYLNLGHLYLIQGKYGQAEKYLNKSRETLTSSVSVLSRASMERPYVYLIEVMEKTNRPAKAKELKAELAKCRATISNFGQDMDEHNIKSVQKRPKRP